MPCEDYPCCGHEPGQCPTQNEDGTLTYRCTCGAPLEKNASSSLCRGCLNRLSAEAIFEGQDYTDRYEDYQ